MSGYPMRSDCLAECVRRSLQTVTDLGQFTRCKVDALLLYIRTRPLTGSILEKALQLLRHILDDVGEVGHLRGDGCYVRFIRHPVLCVILGSHSSRLGGGAATQRAL